MNVRRIIALALALVVPLMFALVSSSATATAASQLTASPAVASSSLGCHDEGTPAPMRTPDCTPDCPVVCAPVASDYRPVVAPILPYDRLRFESANEALNGRAPQPELPPPRGLQA